MRIARFTTGDEPAYGVVTGDVDEYGQPAEASKGMGGGIGQWLLFRAKDADLCLFSLVVPGWRSTPVHDHLAWGLVGLYAGEQDARSSRKSCSWIWQR